ncbi:hypothetical protein WG908_10845 [Sphingobium sp. AN641]|uniref:hypothetical protein n=1 Tax=Sphingobium sp. AN641 TaxID=3133443 RepID=UPI0030C2A9DB
MTLLRCVALLALTYTAALLLGFCLYVGLIRSPMLADMPVLFYRGLALAFVAALLLCSVGAILRRRLGLDISTLLGAVTISLSFNICFLVIFPVTFDRSITMFLLARIERQDGQLDRKGLEGVFVTEYLDEMQQIDRRIAEQSLSGNIRVSHGRISITPQGKQLLAGARTIGAWFDTDPRFITAAPEPAFDSKR